MPKTRVQKQAILEQFKDGLAKQNAIVFVNYKGMGAKEMIAIRTQLKKIGSKLTVTKKTLLKKALADKGMTAEVPAGTAQLATVFAFEDPAPVIKSIAGFARTSERVKILGGYFEGQTQSAEQMNAIAMLPSREELLGMLVGTIAAPMTGFVTVLEGNIKGLVVALHAIAEKKS
ncbi:MAG: 50S ribosomal protein L10 [Candidatus Wildermuthbacteria bacterium RIFCSPHIGHO2_12_FULL_45_9]|uniref:Large ribosomal subunit protein uL10 n=1 Tax=Candidatus Wildermuthbacteria bacterium RIFCSPHIGHO2_02_FULL_45_25 TaxID=1802450 RepID=A0A1G2R162_9BACT|nr:MAG: 50S ribosomal protein L10 [Candidatus Wildermuthbacteria bacterium RIFCSPHIGHO2_01_FULL_45_20]OHA66437.1 MAG: 50S ribosomal protein L10 [Candidatus Wildermuthbacteria bacterium RIFCSPHIGHO2_02_FULL_45_25]OHA71742.1 MAG: 50S ribosomal protein L10 [Candidatus Wildermuthbacteria bacterium RIFCSPHIGHO2_12_FULL_45_9]